MGTVFSAVLWFWRLVILYNLNMFWVIICDIIGLQANRGTKGRILLAETQSLLSRINSQYRDYLLVDFGLIQDSGFAAVLYSAETALILARRLAREAYSSSQGGVRISIAGGELNIINSDIACCSGQAIDQAYKGINQFRKNNDEHWLQICFWVADNSIVLVDGCLVLLSALSKKWTQKQRELIWLVEENNFDLPKVGRQMKTTAASLTKRLAKTGFFAYSNIWFRLTDYFVLSEKEALHKANVEPYGYPAYYSVALRYNQNQYSKQAIELMSKACKIAEKASRIDDWPLQQMKKVMKRLIDES